MKHTTPHQTHFETSPVDDDGPYLLQHRAKTALSELSVRKYRLKVSSGVKPDENADQFTAAATYWLDQAHGTPVAQAGTLHVISLTDLSRSVEVWGRTVTPELVGRPVLDPSEPRDNEDLKQLVQSVLRRAIPSSAYTFRFLNDVVRNEPAFTAESGHFAAHPKYDLKVQVTADGVPLLHVESGHTLRATTTVDHLLDDGADPRGMRVEHDTDRYANPGSGVLVGWSDHRYTDDLEEVGNSIYALHEGNVDDAYREQLWDANPRLLKIRYGNSVRYQLPQLLQLSPRLEQVAEQDPAFSARYNDAKGLLPQTRYIYARNFVESLPPLPILDLEFEPGPSNHGYAPLSIRESTPRLVFADENRHHQPRRGLTEYGVYRSPGRYRIAVLVPDTSSFADLRDAFTPLLTQRLAEIKAPGAVRAYTYELGDVATYTDAAYTIDDDIDVAVCIVPDKEQADSFPGIDDPHHELKRALMRRGIPSQMLMRSTVKRLTETNAAATNHSFINTLSGIVAKAGGTPWQISDLPGPTDAFMGLDVTRTDDNQYAGASASVVFDNGAVFAAESTTFQAGETFRAEHVQQFVRDLVHDFANAQSRPIDHLTILRDGKIPEPVETIREGLSSLDVEFDVVGIRKSGQPRIASFIGEKFQIAPKGIGFVDTDRARAVLHSWGTPETKQDNAQGTPRTLGIVKDSGPTDLETITKQVYWLTEMHFGSPARSTREPVPIRYADDAATFVRKGFVSPSEVISGPAYL